MSATTTRRIPDYFSAADRSVYALVIVWMLSMILLPIFKWTIGNSAIVWGVNVTTVLQATASLAVLHRAWGLRKTATTAMIIVGVTWGVEAIGTATGFPFGHYNYTQVLQPQLANVPLLIAIAWLMMIPPSWGVAYLAAGRQYGPRFVVLSALAMTAWDLFLDPQMVGWNLWQWETPGSFSYFGIPWVNFLGWMATTALITAIVRPRNLPVGPLVTIYSIVWVLQTIGLAIFWGQPAPALVGFVGMGVFVGMAIRQMRHE